MDEPQNQNQTSIKVLSPQASNSSDSVGSATGQTSNKVSMDVIRARAKDIEPACGSLWNIPVGVSVKVLRNQARGILATFKPTAKAKELDNEADNLAEKARPSPETIKSAKEATARIIARRTDDSETVDIAIVTGAAAEIVWGFFDVLSELRQMKKELQNEKATIDAK